MAELLYLRIFAIAEMAFSVGFTFSGSRLCGALIMSTKRGILWAHGTANCSPANWASTPHPYVAACLTSGDLSFVYSSSGCKKMCWYWAHNGPLYSVGRHRAKTHTHAKMISWWVNCSCGDRNALLWRRLLTDHFIEYAQTPLSIGPRARWIK